MKKIIIVMGSLFLAIIIGFIGVLAYKNYKEKEKYEELDYLIRYLNRELSAEILTYGEEYDFRDGFIDRELSDLSAESIGDFANTYKALILVDVKGEMLISDEDLSFIKSCCVDKGMDMFYLGTNTLKRFKQNGFSVGFSEDETGFMYIGSSNIGRDYEGVYGNQYVMHGLFSAQEKTLENVVGTQEILLRQINFYCENYYKILDR